MERLGLVGLPNSGKSTLFNALTGMDVPIGAHPFSTTETVVGVARVPDERVDQLAEMSGSAKRTYTGVEVTDIAALVRGANTGEGLGNRFLGALREVDALLFVVRAFEDEQVPGGVSPLDALETLELELVMADLESVQGRIEKQRKAAKQDASLRAEVGALEKAERVLEDGTALYRSPLGDRERTLLAPSFLLTNKPAMTVVNLGDDQLDRTEELVAPLGEHAVGVCAQLEMEAATLDEGDRAQMLEGLGLGDGVVPRVAAAAHHLLGRRTFLTTGEKESRAWTFREGARAPECAGVIHSDLCRGFIRAEVVRWDELLEMGSWARAKEAGRIRVEGKDYEVADGDVLDIRFNV